MKLSTNCLPKNHMFIHLKEWKQITGVKLLLLYGGAHGVMVIVVGNGHSDTSSNPGRDWLHFT